MDAIKTVITSFVPMSDEEYNSMLPIIERKGSTKRYRSATARRNLPSYLLYRKCIF